MARRNGRGSGRRNGSRALLVREATYALPVVEPCNFMELDFDIVQTFSADFGGLVLPTLSSILSKLPNGTTKFRVTSLVIDPLVLTVAQGTGSAALLAGIATNGSFDVNMSVSGNHYSQSDVTKPLRIRFSNAQGSDGQWYYNTSVSGGLSTISVGGPVQVDGDGNPISVQPSQILGIAAVDDAVINAGAGVIGASTEVHVRVAFTDTSSV